MRSVADLVQRLTAHGAKPVHVPRVLRAWLGGRALRAGEAGVEAKFPADLVQALPALQAELDALVRVESEHPGEDGSARFLLRLGDGRSVESVLLPRDGMCVSTQVGCAVGCVFCMSGRDGLVRQLGALELLAQVVHARRRARLRRVVFMGMGEPAHNLASVLEALTALGGPGGFGHKNLVFSTVGDRRLFERLLANPARPALALSLHTTDDALRAQLLPRAAPVPVAELVELAQAYGRATGHPVQYQWTLLAGVNDSDAELERLLALLAGQRAIVNFIPYNRVEGLPYERPTLDRAREMARWLHRRGVLTKLRRSAGQDVDGACGQLRARALAR